MKKRNVVLISSLVLAVLLVVGGTMAWFTAETKPVANKFKTGTVKIEVNDIFDTEAAQNVNPGDEYSKVVSVTNKGTKDAYIRVKLTPEWQGGLPNVIDVETPEQEMAVLMAKYPLLNNGWVYNASDGWYYYTSVVEAGDSTPNIIEKVKFEGKYMENDYQGKKFTLTVEAGAIQASNGAAEDEWGVNPSTLAPVEP